MKKTLSLIAAYALCCLSALAQWTKPVPAFSDLIVSDLPEQVNAQNAHYFYLYNVEAKGFLLGGNDWNTRATLSPSKGATRC